MNGLRKLKSNPGRVIIKCIEGKYWTMKEGYYHICSEGLEKNLIFRNRKEFIMGMNYVAICYQKYNVRILCFCLMGNHFHFILYGRYTECLGFGNEYKRRCAIMLKRLQNIDCGMHGVEMQIKEIENRQYLEYAIAYVLRNPIAAGYRLMPSQYEWGSGDCYFRNDYSPKGNRIDSYSKIKLAREILFSRASVPGDYILDENLMISPLCYVDYKAVENIFGHPSRLLGLLATKKEADMEIFLGTAEKYNPDIEGLKVSVKELIQEEFGVRVVSQLTLEQKMKLCSLMWKNFRASRKQIAMITKLNMEIINKLL